MTGLMSRSWRLTHRVWPYLQRQRHLIQKSGVDADARGWAVLVAGVAPSVRIIDGLQRVSLVGVGCIEVLALPQVTRPPAVVVVGEVASVVHNPAVAIARRGMVAGRAQAFRSAGRQQAGAVHGTIDIHSDELPACKRVPARARVRAKRMRRKGAAKRTKTAAGPSRCAPGGQ